MDEPTPDQVAACTRLMENLHLYWQNNTTHDLIMDVTAIMQLAMFVVAQHAVSDEMIDLLFNNAANTAKIVRASALADKRSLH